MICSNLIQVAQILQVLVHSKWQAFDAKQSDLYSRFDKDCVSSILDMILEEGPGTAAITFSSSSASSSAESSPGVDSCIDAHRLLLGLNRTVALVTEKELQIFVSFLRAVLTDGNLNPPEKCQLQRLIQPLPVYSPTAKAVQINGDSNGDSQTSSPPRSKRNLIDRAMNMTSRSSNEEAVTTPGCAIERVLILPFPSKNQECIGMLTEQQVLSLQQQAKESSSASLDGSSVPEAEEPNPIQEKRTRFSLSHDDGSIGNTSDNLEAVSEAASNHSVESSVESENEDEAEQDPIDNLSDMISANVSGRGSPNVSGRDTPSSQVAQFQILDTISLSQSLLILYYVAFIILYSFILIEFIFIKFHYMQLQSLFQIHTKVM